jgi:IS30 family transposase
MCENTNGLIRQYLLKGKSVKLVSQQECDAIAERLNRRPRKRHGYKTPMNASFATNPCCTSKLSLGGKIMVKHVMPGSQTIM